MNDRIDLIKITHGHIMLILVIILAACTVYSLLSKSIGKTIITLPIVFTVLGYLASGPLYENIELEVIHEGSRLITEITLILVLFADASHVRFSQLSQAWKIPARMLVIGMPLSLALGTVVIYWLNPASGIAMALLTAAILTPTDAALGQTVVTSPDVPPNLSQTINVEGGLNDGLALPFVLLGAILAAGTLSGHAETDGLAFEALHEIILGPIVGLFVGWVLAKALSWAEDHDTTTQSAAAIIFLSSAFLAYTLAVFVGGNGFIAAFIAGAAFGNFYRHDIHFIKEFMEGAGQLLTMASFLIFGAFLLPQALAHATTTPIIVAVLSLTVVRMLPIFISLTGSGLKTKEKLFLGWFGPRGLASILFTMIMVDEFELPNEQALIACVSLTVAISILLHGLSAAPLAKRIGAAISKP